MVTPSANGVTVEIYMLGERDSQENFGLQAYEIEARWMITEQGQYWADWGMLFELEKQHQIDNWEAKIGVLAEKEFGKSSLTTNLFAIREWGTNAAKRMGITISNAISLPLYSGDTARHRAIYG